ncbi:GNAT family N-acetyltransferase [Jeotgalibacillus sp. R-1-5s-1]|uniref:GNAT family N-acetyltransferase n=1 Tax=Jeotgalibacillus sp. R-1-5s-1 TaxID=2555897 RepID=UPI00106D57DF|nr:GNAT family N-acetyltransferase [Jeotgalibacillus sp. R-1-5s-1]TFE01813.1 GNAT family N-acetyltransferase [Jeotgalibacillus sp. R-1-5s-1]
MGKFEKAAGVIAELNQKPAHHVGYCGVDEQEILKSLKEDIADEYLFFDGDNVLALDYEDGTADMWGPFIKEGKDWAHMADRLLEKVPTGTTLHGFYGKDNVRAGEWVLEHGGEKTSEEYVLSACEFNERDDQSGVVVRLYHDGDKSAFVQLHDSIFPNTYYSAEEILGRTNEFRPLLIATLDDAPVGYVYAESDAEFNEGTIEFLGTAAESRGKGVGYALLRQAMDKLMSKQKIGQLQLCVSKENQTAIHLYKKAGFEMEKELFFYVMKV